MPAPAVHASAIDPVPLGKTGDAKAEGKVNLNGCVGPVIVLRERCEGKIGGRLAGTGT